MQPIDHFRYPDRRFEIAAVTFTALMLVLMVPLARADVRVSLPTEGRYRAGRCIPVRIEQGAGNLAFWLTAAGAVPTEMPPVGSQDRIIPWLIVSETARDAAFSAADQPPRPITTPLRALSGEERLIAFAVGDEGAGPALFPGKSIVPVRLDATGSLLQPAEAWTSLDAVILGEAAAARVTDSDRATLLSAGTLIAVRALARPDDRWPWQRTGDLWVLRASPSGPASAVDSDVYSPTYGWERGWPLAVRQSVVGLVAIYCILGVAVLLWRSRWAVAAFLGLTALFAAGMMIWSARRSPMIEMSVALRSNGPRLEQFDIWTWASPVRSASGSVAASGFTRPVFATLDQIKQAGATLQCAADGRADRFTFRLEPGQSLAFQSRTVRFASPVPKLNRASGAWTEFVDNTYRDADILGQYPAHLPNGNEPLPVIVIHHK